MMRIASLLCLLVLGAAAPGWSQNAVPNGEFDDADQIDGWTGTGISWDGEVDRDDRVGSGSLVATETPSVEATGEAEFPVSNVSGLVEFGAWVLFPADTDPDARATLGANFSNTDCNGSSSLGGVFIDPAPGWQLVTSVRDNVPANTDCVVVNFRVDSSPGATVSIHYDGVFLPEPGASVGAVALVALGAFSRARRHARR